MEYSLAVDDEDYDDKLPAQWWEEEEDIEDENPWPEEDYYDFPDNWQDYPAGFDENGRLISQ